MAELTPSPRPPADIAAHRTVLLLDSEGLVLSAKHFPFESGQKNPSERGISAHEFLHSGCARDCDFENVWREAWDQLKVEDFVEWEMTDQVLDKLLRFKLTRPPGSMEEKAERRQRRALLSIRDITEYRKAHESLRRHEEELVALVRQQSIDLASAHSRLQNESVAVQGDKELMAEFGKKIRALSRNLILAQENERKRIASDLHDGIAQNLTMLKFSIEASIQELHAANAELDLRTLENAAVQAKLAMEEVRRISWNLAPTMLDNLGLQDAIEWHCNESSQLYPDLNIECSLCLGEKETPDLVSIAMYRVMQEGLCNAIRHAGASLIKIAVEKLDDGVSLTITDDGPGIWTEARAAQIGDKSGMGLESMRERVTTTGGIFEIDSGQNRGTVVRATWSEESLRLLAD